MIVSPPAMDSVDLAARAGDGVDVGARVHGDARRLEPLLHQRRGERLLAREQAWCQLDERHALPSVT